MDRGKLKKLSHGSKSKMMVTTGWGVWKQGRCWSKDTKFQLGGIGSRDVLYKTVSILNNILDSLKMLSLGIKGSLSKM
jgi:hypothetical protein